MSRRLRENFDTPLTFGEGEPVDDSEAFSKYHRDRNAGETPKQDRLTFYEGNPVEESGDATIRLPKTGDAGQII